MKQARFVFLGTFENQKAVGIGRDAQFFKESASRYFDSFETLHAVESKSRLIRICNLLAQVARVCIYLLNFRSRENAKANIVFHPQIPTTRTPKFPIANSIHVVRIHDLFPITNPEWFPRGVKLLFKVQLHLLNSLNCIFVCNSEYTISELRKILEPKSESFLIRCPVNQPNAEELCGLCKVCRNPEILESRFAFSLGTLEPRKNLDFISFEWSNIMKTTDVKLIIAGAPGWKIPRISNTSSSVTFLGKICDGALSKLYRSSLLYIAPSKSEGFDIPFHEARSYGIPIIASDIPVHQNFNIRLFNPSDAIEFRFAAIQLLSKAHSTYEYHSIDDSKELFRIWKVVSSKLNGGSH